LKFAIKLNEQKNYFLRIKMPVAGLWKRIKQLVPKALKVGNTLNKVYKKIQPFVDPLLDAVPYGNIVKTGLHGASTGMDVVDNMVDNLRNPRLGDADPYNPVNDIGTLKDIALDTYQTIREIKPRRGFQNQTQQQPLGSLNNAPLFGNPINFEAIQPSSRLIQPF
jgi:hypothetical protein